MIGLPAGTKVFLACQPIDLRAGFDGLAAKVQQIIAPIRSAATCSSFAANAAIISKACIGTAAVCACLPSVLSATNSSGRRSSTAR